jgi:hypothetical protein
LALLRLWWRRRRAHARGIACGVPGAGGVFSEPSTQGEPAKQLTRARGGCAARRSRTAVAPLERLKILLQVRVARLAQAAAGCRARWHKRVR